MDAETLKSLLAWVLIGVGFFLLMRRGGCGGMAHGHGGHSPSHEDEHGHVHGGPAARSIPSAAWR